MPESNPPSLPAISDDETLLRRVPPSYYPDKMNPGCPSHDAFLPRRWKSDDDKGDHTGLSVSREAFTTVETVAKHPDTKKVQNVARISMPQLISIGLSVVADSSNADPSHALIPELNSDDYKNDKNKKAWIKITARKLALNFCEMAYICK